MMLHLRHNGTSTDLSLEDLTLTSNSSDQQIFEALAGHLDLQYNDLTKNVVDRRPSGDIIVRPEAVYG